MHGQVLDIDRRAQERRRAPRRHARADRRAVGGLHIGRRQAGRRHMAQAHARVIHERDRGEQLHAGLRLDRLHHVQQHVGQGHACGDALQHHPLVLQTRQRIRPRAGNPVSLAQHRGPRVAAMAGCRRPDEPLYCRPRRSYHYAR
ncbi:Uncharacterised protein [Bordetella pertussis]|nr:Uncharacterised protein [Bordetella pertussis]